MDSTDFLVYFSIYTQIGFKSFYFLYFLFVCYLFYTFFLFMYFIFTENLQSYLSLVTCYI